jgi:hypothetical protein
VNKTHHGRQLQIPGNVPEDFANAVATVLLLGIAGAGAWDLIYLPTPDESLSWIDGILRANDKVGLVHSDLLWWEHQLRGH